VWMCLVVMAGSEMTVRLELERDVTVRLELGRDVTVRLELGLM
jgi:hypothetical protein